MIRNAFASFVACKFVACLFAALLFIPFAQAQLGAYGMVTVDQISGIQSAYGSQYNNSVNPLGGTFGIFDDLKTIGPVRLGADVRGSILTSKRGALTTANGAGTRLDSALGGVRGSFHVPLIPIKPYVELAAGVGRSNFGVIGPTLTNGFEYHVFAGGDLHLFSILDFRVVELGIGGLDASGHNFPLKSISTGLVIHFPSLP